MADHVDRIVRTPRPSNKTATLRIPPHNIEAEEALLGAALLDPDAFAYVMSEVEAEDLYKPTHQLIYHAMRTLSDGGIMRIDPVMLSDELQAHGWLEDVGGAAALISLQVMVPAIGSVNRYARIVIEDAVRRRMIAVGASITESAYAPGDVTALLDYAKTSVSSVEIPIGDGIAADNVDAYLNRNNQYHWLVEGLLERGDRFMVTGAEGGGKSLLLKQLAVMLSAGVHPFRYHPINPLRVLLVDVENSPGQIGRTMGSLIARIERTWDHDRLRIVDRINGLELTQRHDARWLMELCAGNRPDVLITGPLYKLTSEKLADEDISRRVAAVFDTIRHKFGCAIMLEAHAGHGSGQGERSMRPAGSSLWLRWPEFGYGMRRDREYPRINGRPSAVWFDAWRGPRDEREWPEHLRGDDPRTWPWYDAGTVAPPATGEEREQW